MTTPISSNSPDYLTYDPSSGADGCDSSNASCAAEPAQGTNTSTPNRVNLEPVYISADAGARRLIEEFDKSRLTPDCSPELKAAALACAAAGATALGAVAAATTIIGGVAGFAMTSVASAHCGKELVALSECKAQ